MIALLQFISLRYSVWRLPYSRSQVHGILCDACLITIHKFTVFCVMLALLQFASWQYSVWCLPYYTIKIAHCWVDKTLFSLIIRLVLKAPRLKIHRTVQSVHMWWIGSVLSIGWGSGLSQTDRLWTSVGKVFTNMIWFLLCRVELLWIKPHMCTQLAFRVQCNVQSYIFPTLF